MSKRDWGKSASKQKLENWRRNNPGDYQVWLEARKAGVNPDRAEFTPAHNDNNELVNERSPRAPSTKSLIRCLLISAFGELYVAYQFVEVVQGRLNLNKTICQSRRLLEDPNARKAAAMKLVAGWHVDLQTSLLGQDKPPVFPFKEPPNSYQSKMLASWLHSALQFCGYSTTATKPAVRLARLPSAVVSPPSGVADHGSSDFPLEEAIQAKIQSQRPRMTNAKTDDWHDHVNAVLTFVAAARDKFGAENLPTLINVPVSAGKHVVVKTANVLTLLHHEEAKLATGRWAYGVDRPLNRAQRRMLGVALKEWSL